MPTIARRIKELSKTHSTVSFIVETPESRDGVQIQAVVLRDFKVVKAGNGSEYVIGRDITKELRKDRELSRVIPPGAHRKKSELQIRQYKISRIVQRSIIDGKVKHRRVN